MNRAPTGRHRPRMHNAAPSGLIVVRSFQPPASANSIYTSWPPRVDINLYVAELPEAEPRHQRRYNRLIVAHLSPAHRVAAGLQLPAATAQPFAATQAAWRFYSNPRLSLPQLAQPLIDAARQGVAEHCRDWLLVPMDWCNLHLSGHTDRLDRVALAHRHDLGYELLTALTLEDRRGQPLAPLCLELRAADGMHSTRLQRLGTVRSKLDRLRPVMDHVRDLALGKPPVFLIDREADSVDHYRQWNGQGHRFVVRANATPTVLHEFKQQSLEAVAQRLTEQNQFVFCGEVLFKGRKARQFVAETSVVLARAARRHRVDKSGVKRHQTRAGKPLLLRLVVSQIRDERGTLLAQWLLLSNLPASVTAATVALWYYWRWRIESYHKLLKGAGQQIECWQQQTAEAWTRRLAVAAMAGVVVWRLARDRDPAAEQLRHVLVRLSGRQMKRGKTARGFTESALLAGLGVLIPMLELLRSHSVAELRQLLETSLPGVLQTPPADPPTGDDG